MSAPRARLRTRFIASLLTFGLALASLEAAATVVLGERFERGTIVGTWKDVARFDPTLGWSCLPNARAVVSNGEISYRVRLNSAGYRDPERSLAKPAGVRRVVLLGDSCTWGWGVDDGERFSDLLEARLGPDVELINLAVPGYGTDQQLWTLVERGFAYEPDAVFVGVVSNDIMEASSSEVYGMPKPRFERAADGAWTVVNRPVTPPLPRWRLALREHWRRLLARSALLSWAGGVSLPDETATAPVRERFNPPNERVLEQVRAAGAAIGEPGGLNHELLGRIAAACTERGVALVAAVIPHKHDQYLYEPNFPRPEIDPAAEQLTELTRGLFTAAERFGFEAVSLDRAMLAAVDKGRRLQCGDGHFNEEGNGVVAGVLEPVLRRLLAVPGR